MRSSDIVQALRRHHQASPTPARSHAFLAELRSATGYNTAKSRRGEGYNRERRFDAWVLGLWPSHGIQSIIYEIKVSRADFLQEIKDPDKRAQALQLSTEFYFACPAGLIKPEEIPEETGLVYVQDDGKIRRVVQAPVRSIDGADWFPLLQQVARRATVAEWAIQSRHQQDLDRYREEQAAEDDIEQARRLADAGLL